MATDNRNATDVAGISMNVSASPAVIEFNWPLHVHKKRFRGGEDYLYTIAVWKSGTLNSICLMQPLETALNALAELLRKAGTDLPLPADQPLEVASLCQMSVRSHSNEMLLAEYLQPSDAQRIPKSSFLCPWQENPFASCCCVIQQSY